MSGQLYRETQAEVLARAENRLADIRRMVLETTGGEQLSWMDEEQEQLRIIERVKKGRF